MFRKDAGVAGATSGFDVSLRFCRLDLCSLPFVDPDSLNLLEELFRGGGGGIDEDGKWGSGETESEDSLWEPFVTLRLRLEIEFRFRVWDCRFMGENGARRTLR